MTDDDDEDIEIPDEAWHDDNSCAHQREPDGTYLFWPENAPPDARPMTLRMPEGRRVMVHELSQIAESLLEQIACDVETPLQHVPRVVS